MGQEQSMLSDFLLYYTHDGENEGYSDENKQRLQGSQPPSLAFGETQNQTEWREKLHSGKKKKSKPLGGLDWRLLAVEPEAI